MREELREILYGDVYKADPGSDWYKEQTRRIDAAIILMEEEMAKKRKKEPVIEGGKDIPTSFVNKIHKKTSKDEEK